MATDASLAPPAPDASSTRSTDQIAQSAGRAGAATLASRLLGVVREQVLAASFGAGHDMDAFVVAFRIPNLVRDLLAEGAMSAAFVPTFTRQLTLRGRDEAWRLGNSVINGLLVVTGTLVLMAMLGAGPLVRLFASEFADVPGKLELTTRLARVVLPFLMLASVAAAVMGMLNSLRHYFVPALAPATFNVATIVCIAVLGPLMPRLGWPAITVVAIAALVGGLSQIAIQWPLLRREGFRYRAVLDWHDPAFRQVLLMMGPGTLGLAATQINLLVTTILAAREGAGAVSWLQYAFRLMYVPIGLFGVSIATAILPSVARHLASDDRQAVRQTVAHGILLMLVVNLPAGVGLYVLAPETVRLLFERGRFVAADTAATALALQCYAVGLVGYAAARIVSPVFYALGKSRIAVTLSVVSIAINLALSVTLVRVVGFSGLALATALAAIFNGTLSLLLLRRQLGRLDGTRIVVTLMKMAIASAAMAAATRGVMAATTALWPGDDVLHQAGRLAAAIAAGIVVLAVAVTALRIREADELFGQIRRRLGGRLAARDFTTGC